MHPSSRAVNSARELGPWTRVVETDLKGQRIKLSTNTLLLYVMAQIPESIKPIFVIEMLKMFILYIKTWEL